MFLEFAEGSFLWDWHYSPIGVLAMWVSFMVAIVMLGSRTRTTYSGQVLKFLAMASVLLTLPLGLVRMGLTPDMMDTGIVGELGFFGFIVSIACIAVPCLAGTLLYAIKPGLFETVNATDDFLGHPATFVHSLADIYAPEPLNSNGQDSGQDNDADQWELEFISGSAAGKTIRIPGPEVTLGRSTECDVVIEDPYVSRQHATLSVRDVDLFLTDLGSTAGSVVNGNSVVSSTIESGSEVVLGETLMRFEKLARY